MARPYNVRVSVRLCFIGGDFISEDINKDDLSAFQAAARDQVWWRFNHASGYRDVNLAQLTYYEVI